MLEVRDIWRLIDYLKETILMADFGRIKTNEDPWWQGHLAGLYFRAMEVLELPVDSEQLPLLIKEADEFNNRMLTLELERHMKE